MFISSNPSTGKRIFTQDILSDQTLLLLIENCQKGYLINKKQSITDRVSFVNTLINDLKGVKFDLASIITEEIGKPITQSVAEIEKCIDLCEHYASNAQSYLKEEKLDTEYLQSKICYQPLGVILGIMPWNFPFWQVFRFAIPTILAGNSVLIKHAPNVSKCAGTISKLFDEAGFGGIYQNIFASTEQSESIIKNQLVRGVSLTGSCEAGSSVGALASKYLKPQILELGGSDVFIVNDSTDIGTVVKAALSARLQNNGQSCIAGKRFLIKNSVMAEFKKLLTEGISKIQIGLPENIDTNVGPLVREDLRDEYLTLLKRGKEQGAELINEKEHNQLTGFYVNVSIFEVFDSKNCLMQREVFGPCFVLKEYSKIDEAIDISNDSSFGLSSSIWTNDESIKTKCINEIETGAVFINRISKSDPRLPFGGIKDSGIGRELGEEGIKAFVNKKLIVE